MKEITFPSGAKRNWQRPPRFVLWRHGKTAQTFGSRMEAIATGGEAESYEDQGLLFFASLTDDEACKFQAFVDDVVKHSVTLLPGETVDAISEQDYWHAFGLTMYNHNEAPIETTEGETTAAAVGMFPIESALPVDSASMPHLRAEAEPVVGNI